VGKEIGKMKNFDMDKMEVLIGNCSICIGKGFVVFDISSPNNIKKYKCPLCKGRGKLLIIPENWGVHYHKG
jgi:hypothetical protein